MNHYPRHVGDYIRDTVGLTMLEEGAYTRLLDQYYAREAALPADKPMLYRIARATTRQERQAVDAVLVMFFTPGPDGYHQKRADKELAAQRDRSESARQSAQQRWSERNANAPPNAMPTHMPTHSEGNAESMLASSHKPVAIDQKQDQEQSRAAAPPPPPKAPRGKRLPADWALPPDWAEWARAERPEWDERHVLRVSLKFRDYWLGKGRPMVDWLATWRNWVRDEKSAGSGNGRAPTLAEKRADNIADLCGRKNAERPDARTLDGTAVRAADGDLRQPDVDDVGRLPARGHHGRLA